MKLKSKLTYALIVFAFATSGILGRFSAQAFADTFSNVMKVAETQSESFAGGDAFGNYTINVTDRLSDISNYNCGGVTPGASGQCFETHYIDGTVSLATTAPALWTDPNAVPESGPCTSTVAAGFTVSSALGCGDDMIFAGTYSGADGTVTRGIWGGSDADPTRDYLGNGSMDGGFMSGGNAYFIDGLNNTLDVVLNLTDVAVPEPNGLILLGTGVFSMLGMVRLGGRRKASRTGN